MKIYVASSWRNNIQPEVVKALRKAAHEVYDFKNLRPGDHGFHWSDIDPDWKNWIPEQFIGGLRHPIAARGFASDMDALRDCDICVLVMPCGRSAHLEAGWAAGAGKQVIVYILEACEPELMYKMTAAQCASMDDLLQLVAECAAAPVLDVAPVAHGAWCCVAKNPYQWKCSKCHELMPVYPTETKANFCPNCGADMRKKS